MNSLDGKRILVFGGSGRLGSDLLPILKARGASIIAPRSEDVDIGALKVFQCVSWHNADIVLNLAAHTDVPEAETHKGRDLAVRTNIHGNKHVCEAAHYFDAKVIYISSDYVYPGVDSKPYEIEDAHPSCSYGITKFVGEWFCDPDKDLVIRTSFKARGTWGKNALNGVFHPVVTNGDWVDIIAEKIADVICDDRIGIINLGTKKKFLRDLALAEYPLVKIIDVEGVDLGYKYPTDSSMVLDD